MTSLVRLKAGFLIKAFRNKTQMGTQELHYSVPIPHNNRHNNSGEQAFLCPNNPIIANLSGNNGVGVASEVTQSGSDPLWVYSDQGS